MMNTKIKRFKIIDLLKHPGLKAGIKPLWDQADPHIDKVAECRNKFPHGVAYSNNPSDPDAIVVVVLSKLTLEKPLKLSRFPWRKHKR
jgi:hypothetical protein